MIGWYTEYAIPQWVPAKPVKSSLSPFPTSVSHSPLCHASVSQWFGKSGYTTDAPEFLERCGRLTGDVTKKTAELLNASYKGTFQPTYTAPASIQTCTHCHAKNQLGQQECMVCHKPLGHNGIEFMPSVPKPETK